MDKGMGYLVKMYAQAAGLKATCDNGIYVSSEEKRILEEEIRGSAEFAGFIDAVLGKPPKYREADIESGPLSRLEGACAEMIKNLRKSFKSAARRDDNDFAGECLSITSETGYISGYKLGINYKTAYNHTDISPREPQIKPESRPHLKEVSGNVIRPDPSVWGRDKKK